MKTIRERVDALRVEVDEAIDRRWVVTARPVRAGEVVCVLPPVYTQFRGRHTIELAPERHQAYTGDIDDYIEHSCAPNLALDFKREAFVALCDIREGEEVFWNYLTAEWEMESPFRCRDRREGRGRCYELISGASKLSREELEDISRYLSPAIRRRISEE